MASSSRGRRAGCFQELHEHLGIRSADVLLQEVPATFEDRVRLRLRPGHRLAKLKVTVGRCR